MAKPPEKKPKQDFSKVVKELQTQTVALNKLAGIEAMTTASDVEDKNKEKKSQSRLLQAVLATKKGILGVGSTLGKFAADKGKEFKGNIFGMLKKLAFGAAVAALLVFLNSEYWEKTKVLLQDKIIPAVITLYDTYLKPFFTSIGNISKNFKNMLEDPSWENLTAFFGSAG